MPEIQSLSTPLWIMAAAAIVEVLVLVGMIVGGYLFYARMTAALADLERRQIAPLREQVDTILDNVQAVTARVAHQTERVDHAITGTIDRVDETAARVRAGVHDKVSQAAGVMRGIRAVIMTLLRNRESHA